GLAAVFNVHAEQDRARDSRPGRQGVITDAGETDLVGWRPARFRTARPCTRIAQASDHEPRVGILRAGQARTEKTVEALGMEVPPATALLVPADIPVAVNARTLGVTRGGGADRRAPLPAVRHETHGRERVILTAATRNAAIA